MKDPKEITYNHEWIQKLESQLHWKLYWHQLNLILNKSSVSKSDRIVEVGIGSGLTSSYLKRKGFNILTVDIDKNKNPDIVANILTDDISSADVYLAFEILEHIPFDGVGIFLKKLSELNVKQIIFSIPHAYRTYIFIEVWLPYIGYKTFHVGRKRSHINAENHHWELGIGDITLNTIEELFLSLDYTITDNFRYRNHHFFISKLMIK